MDTKGKVILTLKKPIEIDLEQIDEILGDKLVEDGVVGPASHAEIRTALEAAMADDGDFVLESLGSDSFDIAFSEDAAICGAEDESVLDEAVGDKIE